jgi:RNA polymerase sigma factor (sigma-70 family)
MSTTTVSGEDWAELAGKAMDGSEAAWRRIVDRLSGVVWSVLMTYKIEPADREDAYASTFFKLYEKLHTVNDPNYLPGWIATAARREANSIWRQRKRTQPTDKLPLREIPLDLIDERLLDSETLAEVMKAVAELPAETQTLLRLLTVVPPLSYDEIAVTLDMPKGSIGPTAGRAFEKIRKALQAKGLSGAA